MNKYTAEDLKNILENHTKWLNNDDGTRANLRGANLSKADLSEADLSKAYLWGAYLRGANLSRADLRGANLSRADLSEAYLWGADLRGANLSKADLRGADLSEADLTRVDLSEAYLRGANISKADLSEAYLWGADLHNAILPGQEIMNSICPINCPEKGAFIGWKKANAGVSNANGTLETVEVIIELQIIARAKRLSATGRKCRCDKALVLDIQSLDGVSLPKETVAYSRYMPTFTYEVGQKLYVEDFDDNRWNECSTGIHFFITRQEAVDY